MYADAAKMIQGGMDATGILAECERLEKKIGDNPADVLYSEQWEKRVSYAQMVLEIQNAADNFIFSLAGNKGETVDSLKRKTVLEIMSFAERLEAEFKKAK